MTNFQVGDRDQRYEVRAKNSQGKEIVFGWTDCADGDALVKSINLHPSFHSPRVIDRKADTKD